MSNSVSALADYSSTETAVGTWHGKPLYRQEISFTTTAEQTAVGTISNVDEVKSLTGIARNELPINFYFGTNYIATFFANGTLYTKSVGYANQSAFAILEYTKTTD